MLISFLDPFPASLLAIFSIAVFLWLAIQDRDKPPPSPPGWPPQI